METRQSKKNDDAPPVEVAQPVADSKDSDDTPVTTLDTILQELRSVKETTQSELRSTQSELRSIRANFGDHDAAWLSFSTRLDRIENQLAEQNMQHDNNQNLNDNNQNISGNDVNNSYQNVNNNNPNVNINNQNDLFNHGGGLPARIRLQQHMPQMEDLSVSHAQGQPHQPHQPPQLSQPIPRSTSDVVPVLHQRNIKSVVEDELRGIRLDSPENCFTALTAECKGRDLIGSVAWIRTNFITRRDDITYEVSGEDISPTKANAIKITFSSGYFSANFGLEGGSTSDTEVRRRVFQVENPITFVVKLDKAYDIPLLHFTHFSYDRAAVPSRREQGFVHITMKDQYGYIQQTLKLKYESSASLMEQLNHLQSHEFQPHQVDVREADQWIGSQGSMTSGESGSSQSRLIYSSISAERTRDAVEAKLKEMNYLTVRQLLQQHPSILEWQKDLKKKNELWHAGMPTDIKLTLDGFTKDNVVAFFNKVRVYRQKGGITDMAQMVIQSNLSSELATRLRGYGISDYLQLQMAAREVKDLTDDEVIALLLYFSDSLEPARWMAVVFDLIHKHLTTNKSGRCKIFHLYKFFNGVMKACEDIRPSTSITASVRDQIKANVSSFDSMIWYNLGLSKLWNDERLKLEPLSSQISEFLMLLRCLKTTDSIVKSYRNAASNDMINLFYDIQKFERAIDDHTEHIVPDQKSKQRTGRGDNKSGYTSDSSRRSNNSTDSKRSNKGKHAKSRRSGSNNTSGQGKSDKKRDFNRNKSDSFKNSRSGSFGFDNGRSSSFQNNNNNAYSDQKGNRQHPPKSTSKFPSGNSTGSKRSASGRGVVNDSLSVDSETIVTDDELLDLTLVQDQQSDGDHGQENSIDQELPASTHEGTPDGQYVQMVDPSQTH